MPAPPPMKISVNVPMNSATPQRSTFSSIEGGFWEVSRTDGFVQLGSLRGGYTAVELRGRVPALPQELQRRDDRRLGSAVSRVQVPALPALRPVCARGGARPARADLARRRRLADGVAERLRFGQVLVLLLGVVLDLTDPLACD